MRRMKLRAVVALAIALTGMALTATPVQAAHMTVVTISGEVDFGGGAVVQVGAHARGPAGSLTGQGFDTSGKPGGVVPPQYCRFPLTGSVSGDVVTLLGAVTFSPDPTLIGAPVVITANAATGAITFNFAGFIATGTGSVVIAHR